MRHPSLILTKSLAWLILLGSLALSGCRGEFFRVVNATRTSPATPGAQTTLVANETPGLSASPGSAVLATETATSTATLIPTDTPTPTETPLPTESPAPTETIIPSETSTPTEAATPTITLTPTYDFPDAMVVMQANCRYGPGTAYLYSHGLYPGDQADVHGRNYSGTWLWIKPENLERHCWAAASVLEVAGNTSVLAVVRSKLPQSTLYGPPQNVQASRDGDRVVVTWERVWMTEDDDRGYLIEATICQNGFLVPVAVRTDGNSYEFSDARNCAGDSEGILYTVEKHGYTTPVKIPWP